MNDIVKSKSAISPQQNQDLAQMSHNAQVESQRAIQEVQAAYVIAKKYPRNENAAFVKMTESCKRPGLAKVSQYRYPKGGQEVSGPSIRLAEVVARAWGNMRYGFKVLERNNGTHSRPGSSQIRAYCLDLETNLTKDIEFTIEHSIGLKNNQKKILTDGRDIYELEANQAQRRVRNCVLATIPEDILSDVIAVCNKTLMGIDSELSLKDRIKKLAVEFSTQFNVSTEMLEKYLDHKLELTQAEELVELRQIYAGLRDKTYSVKDYFEQTKPNIVDVKPLFTSSDKAMKEDLLKRLSKMGIASDTQQTVIEQMEGKDLDIDLPKVIQFVLQS